MQETTGVGTEGNSLLKAVYLSRLRLTRLLLEGGAYINESNEHGETPLMVACKTRHTDAQSVPKHKMVRYLLENGADPNIQDKKGRTALMHACLEKTEPEILSLLLSNGADPTLEDHAGFSALVYAINLGNRDVLAVLLEACKAKGKEVIIITTNKMPSGQQMTKQYLNVPPPPDLEERLHCVPASSCMSSYPQASLQGPSATASSKYGSSFLGFRDPPSLDVGPNQGTSPPGSPTQHPGSSCVSGTDKHFKQRPKSPSTLIQQHQASSLNEEQVELTPEDELSFRVNSLAIQGRASFVSRHHSIDVKDATGILKALENMSGNESRPGGGRRGFGRKMSYDSAASSLHSASHPNLHQDSLAFHRESSPVDEDSSDSLRQLNVSSLQNVVRLRNIGINHYSSDSQLLQFGGRDKTLKSGSGQERQKGNSRASTLSGSRESLESCVQRRRTAGLERRGSGALLLDHIAHTRPGYLPPINPHSPIPDIGSKSSSSYSFIDGKKTMSGGLMGPKPVLPCAPVFPQDLKAQKMLWRRHSMQSEQIKQLVNFEEIFGD
ncbi:ankyrin repeat domain 34Bb [Cololabis saira]|uniref:ankyrin repeat domain 34Bb n=1 Tax=Cololabis saira TaxID=129043 RepID=UPI002AD3A5D7|nr:ankyrin repeat domain 34Bb [Cololabis saira]